MHDIQLNLARKWRAQQFDQIIGQDLSIRMLKNSLYRGHFFPVYLFWGQHGTGKTSMARVFAASVNCQALSDFQLSPKEHVVPCLKCTSCRAMLEGNHPDFIEIDAASHTGVDNVRTIIEAAGLLPMLGRKKIYLIDEAHMLSKAAFNAFLKILEEPPASALFILATTDQQKILETVRSRCFQLFFKPVVQSVLHDHIAAMCKRESIYADDNALELIVQESGGSVRDAINLLEQVRFAQGRITRETVLQALGHVNDGALIQLIDCLLSKTCEQVVHFLNESEYEKYTIDAVWKRLVELIRNSIWLSYGLSVPLSNEHKKMLAAVIQKVGVGRLAEMLETLYQYERVFLRTASKQSLFEFVLLKIAQNNEGGGPNMSPVPQCNVCHERDDDDEECDEEIEEDEGDDTQDIDEVAPKSKPQVVVLQKNAEQNWQRFIELVESLHDPLLCSIFKQGRLANNDIASGCIEVEFAKQFSFFQEWISSTTKQWLPLLCSAFQKTVTLNANFSGNEPLVPLPTKEESQNRTEAVAQPVAHQSARETPKNVASQAPRQYASKWQQRVPQKRMKRFDVSDVAQWPIATMLKKYFPGTIYEG